MRDSRRTSLAGHPLPRAVCLVAALALAPRLAGDSLANRLGLESPEMESARSVTRPDEATLTGEYLPEMPPEMQFVDRLIVRPSPKVIIRPTGSPWFLPHELGSSEYGDNPGPGFGLSLRWTPSAHWRFGADLIVRAERMDADNRLHDWTGYLAPGVEFIPHPYSERPFALGVVLPGALRPRDERWAGAFLIIRWMDAGARKPGGVRGNDD